MAGGGPASQAPRRDSFRLSHFHLPFKAAGGQMPRVCQETVSSRCLFEEVLLALDESGKSVRRLLR